MRLQRRKNLSDRPIGSERFGQCARADASFANVLADDIREYLWAADLSLRAFFDDFSAPQRIPHHGTPPPAPASWAMTVMKGSLE
jgi:hypothetical protein